MRYSNLNELVVSNLADLSVRHSYLSRNGGHIWRFFFPNGFGASIVKHTFSYGNEYDLWEVAAICGTTDDNFELYYCDLTNDDVVGWLTEEEVLELAQEISKM